MEFKQRVLFEHSLVFIEICSEKIIFAIFGNDQKHKSSLGFLYEAVNSSCTFFFAASFSDRFFNRKFWILFSGYVACISFFNL